MPFALVRWYVRALGAPLCPLGHLFSAGGPAVASPFASAIKHQMSSNIKRARARATRLGRPLGPYHPPPGPPHGWAVRPCRASASLSPLYFVLALRELGLRLGVKVSLPLRASSHGVLPGAGALAGYRTPIQPVCS
jgi:hypothetical protein